MWCSYLGTLIDGCPGGFVKIVILSDIHSNLAALKALPEKFYDHLWCLGDLVDYGPEPRGVIKWIRENSAIAIRGNHDNAVGFDVDPYCSQPFKRLAEETRQFTKKVCTTEDLEYLRSLAVQQETTIDGMRFFLVHATSTDPLFGYCQKDSGWWKKEIEWAGADVLAVGHTHTPFIRKIGNTTIVNPGRLGQPKTGRPLACYAVWENGQIFLKEYPYPLAETIREIRKRPVSQDDQNALITVLKTGALPGPEMEV
jgi:putative phosphoesterase